MAVRSVNEWGRLCLFKKGSYCVVPAVLRLAKQAMLASNSEILCLRLPSAGIKGECYHRQLERELFNNYEVSPLRRSPV